MESASLIEQGILYSSGHVWIKLQGDIATIGVTSYRIAGVKRMLDISFFRIYGPKKKGDVVATIRSDTGSFKVYMPLDGRVTAVNDVSFLTAISDLSDRPETDWWLAKIELSQPCRTDMLLSRQEYTKMMSPNRH